MFCSNPKRINIISLKYSYILYVLFTKEPWKCILNQTNESVNVYASLYLDVTDYSYMYVLSYVVATCYSKCVWYFLFYRPVLPIQRLHCMHTILEVIQHFYWDHRLHLLIGRSMVLKSDPDYLTYSLTFEMTLINYRQYGILYNKTFLKWYKYVAHLDRTVR